MQWRKQIRNHLLQHNPTEIEYKQHIFNILKVTVKKKGKETKLILTIVPLAQYTPNIAL